MRKWWSVALLILVIAAVGVGSYFVVGQKPKNDLFQHRVKLSQELEASGVMNAQDFVRWQYITDDVVKTGTISDSDLNWMLRIMRNPQTAMNDPQIVHGDVLGTLTHLRQIPAAQEEKIYSATLPLLSSDKKLDKLYAAKMMRKLNDKRAVPYLKPLLNDPDPDVQLLAHRALEKLE